MAPAHTLFQVSTSGALVAGVSSGAISCEQILQHGDFGVGTFAHLDGEMVVLDGHIYRLLADGTVSEASADASAPFVAVTRFAPQVDCEIAAADSIDALLSRCDQHRTSGNLFYACRLDGVLHTVRVRAIRPPTSEHGGLLEAARTQAEFAWNEISGTLVGIWSPDFFSAIGVPGYHLHFISNDRQHGGHLLACATGPLRLRVDALTDFHLALPDTESFLTADLRQNPADKVAYAEKAH
jgi:acetolactate decarboxylase